MDFVFLVFMAAMIIAGLVVGKLAGKKLGKAEFDERQQLARGKAYKAGFYTLLVGLLAVYLVPILTEWQPRDTALLPFLAMCIGVRSLPAWPSPMTPTLVSGRTRAPCCLCSALWWGEIWPWAFPSWGRSALPMV